MEVDRKEPAMSPPRIAGVVVVLATSCCLGCGGAEPSDLTAEQSAALDASIASLEPVRADLPIGDSDLHALGTRFVLRTQARSVCAQQGIVAGVWYDASLQPLVVGSWFELGTGERGGTIAGQYASGQYEGVVTGPEIEGTLEGPYRDGWFDGSWAATLGAAQVPHEGDLIGRYERRNETGGYFFGVWDDCTTAE
jgi:hypothetical protein